MKMYGFILLLLALGFAINSANADVLLETRAGVTTPHSEGRPIARFLSETELTYTYKSFEATLIGNIYGTQNWRNRVKNENGMFKVDAVRFEYGADVKYWVLPSLAAYARHTMPIDRHDKSIGDGWHDTSYRWDVGIIFRKEF